MNEITEIDYKLIDELIRNVGLSISELYSSLNDDMYNFLKLSQYIELEKTMYKEFNLSYKKCSLILKYVEDTYIEEIKDSEEEDTPHMVFSVNRFLNRISYEARGIDYTSNGHIKHMVDFMTQVLYSELILDAEMRPNMKHELVDYAYTRLNMSPSVEEKAIKNKFREFPFYENNIPLFLGIKNKKKELDISKSGEAKLQIDSTTSVESLFGIALRKVVEPDLNFAFKNLCNLISEGRFSMESASTIILMVTLKSLLAMYPEVARHDLYQKFYSEIRKLSDNDLDILDAIEDLFWQTESGTVSKILNIDFGIRTRKKN